MERNTENLFTSSLAISASPDRLDLSYAAFWVHLRQDIHIALLLQVPISTDYPPSLQREKILQELNSITVEETSVRQEVVDCAWANRIAVLLMDIVNFCFRTQPRDLERWIELRGRVDHWRMAKPSRFQPYYERAPSPAEGRYFPDIWLATDCYVLAWLYYHMATVLLKIYPPSPGGSGTRANAGPTVDNFESREEVLVHARAICGLVRTNPNAQTLIVLCHMVTISAIFFTEEAEKNETIDLLRMAHAITGHPLRDVEQKLRRSWAAQANS